MLSIFVLTILACMMGGGLCEDTEATTLEPETVDTAFNKHEIIPDVIDNPPKELMSVKYETVEPNLGNALTPTSVQNQPTVNWTTSPDKLYTLIMIDPDARSRKNPEFRSFLHWLVGNIPGTDITKGEVFANYLGSGPPKDTGLHRYIFLVYEQPEKIKFDEPIEAKLTAQNRPKFDVRKFTEKYKLGQPISGNFYQAEYDSYVDELHKKLNA